MSKPTFAQADSKHSAKIELNPLNECKNGYNINFNAGSMDPERLQRRKQLMLDDEVRKKWNRYLF